MNANKGKPRQRVAPKKAASTKKSRDDKAISERPPLEEKGGDENQPPTDVVQEQPPKKTAKRMKKGENPEEEKTGASKSKKGPKTNQKSEKVTSKLTDDNVTKRGKKNQNSDNRTDDMTKENLGPIEAPKPAAEMKKGATKSKKAPKKDQKSENVTSKPTDVIVTKRGKKTQHPDQIDQVTKENLEPVEVPKPAEEKKKGASKSKKRPKKDEVASKSTENFTELGKNPDLKPVEEKKKTKKAPKKDQKSEKAASNDDLAQASSSQDKVDKPLNRSILQLKVVLHDITPPIWRRIQVLNNDTFFNLHCHLKQAMGWMAPHSHQFIMHDPKKNTNILIVDGSLEGLTYDFTKERGRLFKGQTTKLSKYLSAKGDRIFYEYDLGDSWLHEIVVEKVLPPPGPKAEFPKCTGGKRACPPEDCGGVDGYQHLLEVYNDPNHEEYEELIIDWLGESNPGWDPEKFDKKEIFKRVWMWVQK